MPEWAWTTVGVLVTILCVVASSLWVFWLNVTIGDMSQKIDAIHTHLGLDKDEEADRDMAH